MQYCLFILTDLKIVFISTFFLYVAFIHNVKYRKMYIDCTVKKVIMGINGKYLYTSKEFAQLANVNKRTLHYYNDIQLFKPEVIGENGFHYYTCFQFAQLELILILRKVGLSIEEIKDYMKAPSQANFYTMMEKRKQLIDETINQLLEIKKFLELKSNRLEQAFSARHGKIEIVNLPQRKVKFSQPKSGKYDANDFTIAAQFALELKQQFHLYDSFGSVVSMDAIKRNAFNEYDYFFAYCPDTYDNYDILLPQGTYLRTYCIGEWNNLATIYQKIIRFANENKIQLSGYAYEEGLNEMSLQDKHEYITMITIKCDPISQ